MGISIHYRGTIDRLGDLPELTDELKTIAEGMEWEAGELADDWDAPVDATLTDEGDSALIEGNLGLRGVVIQPGEDCEPLCFCFNREGQLLDPMTLILLRDGTLDPDDAWVSVKTQYASADLHVWIVGLLRYVKNKYVSDMAVHDEGEYWDREDRELLEAKRGTVARAIDALAAGVDAETLSRLSESSDEQIAAALEKIMYQFRLARQRKKDSDEG